MKRLPLIIPGTLGVLVLLITLGAFTCDRQIQPAAAYVGNWGTSSTSLTVRTKTGFMKYKFTPVSVPVSLNIASQGLATCALGDIKLNNLNVMANKGNSEKTGIIYIIRCGEVGNLNSNDPADKKVLELWIKPMKSDNKLHMEIRQMHTLDPFPMGEVVLEKQP